MDKTKKSLKDQECCNFCMNYNPIKKDGYKTSKGRCAAAGTIKKRTDKCKKSFKNKRMQSFFDTQ